jgi:arylsulfatase A-like enzyme
VGFALRTARTHFRGDVGRWLDIDRDIGRTVVKHVRTRRPAFTFAAFTGIDKSSHAVGHDAPLTQGAMRIVDDVVAELRHDATRAGRWEETHVWIVSDHGHAPVTHHHDLAQAIALLGYRVLAHPRIWISRPDVAVMVSGNAMAHVYVDLRRYSRAFWPRLAARWTPLADALLAHPSVDLLILPLSPTSCRILHRTRGEGFLSWTNAFYSYETSGGDPLDIGPLEQVTASEAYDATIGGAYPDALVQIAALAGAARSGDCIVSATPGWDFRAHYEPIPHVSSHGSLHRDHMRVPLLMNHPTAGTPRRTVDIMPSIAQLLGITPPTTDGASFI